jgi:uncharacterized protein (DUF952 family)
MIHHLVPADAWHGRAPGTPWAPESLDVEGFVHCSPDMASVLVVADRFYAGASSLVVVDIDDAELGPALIWEPAAHPDGAPTLPDDPEFPHVYGAIPESAIIGERTLVRGPTGWQLDEG